MRNYGSDGILVFFLHLVGMFHIHPENASGTKEIPFTKLGKYHEFLFKFFKVKNGFSVLPNAYSAAMKIISCFP